MLTIGMICTTVDPDTNAVTFVSKPGGGGQYQNPVASLTLTPKTGMSLPPFVLNYEYHFVINQETQPPRA